MHELQSENLRLSTENLKLSTKQLRRYWLYTLASFTLEIIATLITAHISEDSKEDKKIIENRITILEQTANRLEDSIQILKVSYTKQKDSSSTK